MASDNRELVNAIMSQQQQRERLTPQQQYQQAAMKQAMSQGQKPVRSAPEALANMGTSAAGAYMLWKMLQEQKAKEAGNAPVGSGLAAGFDNPGGQVQAPPQGQGSGMKPQGQQPPDGMRNM